ncbi:MAG: ferrochelatase [Armatimonadota bacterium]|nr:ferrochelatase [Armatimonadota bacterium]MDR7473807.1 ferrochelatase [Armatimonadota bacterium]
MSTEVAHGGRLAEGGETGWRATPAREAVLLMAYGSPATLAEVGAYYTHIRGGRPPSAELLAELVERYRAIGGRSPLVEITHRQAAALEATLAARGYAVSVRAGMRHAPPFIGDVIREMAAARIRHAVGMALAPHYSRLSVGVYVEAAEQARPPGLTLTYITSWGDHPGFLAAVAARLRAAAQRFPAAPYVVFTAHSLPQRIRTWDDPYPEEVNRSAAGAARLAALPRWTVAYQSAGRTPEPWLGPDLLSTLERLRREGEREVLVCPIGFVADHLEVLYDIDVEAQGLAARLGLRLERTAMPNDAPDFITALADLVAPHLGARVP